VKLNERPPLLDVRTVAPVSVTRKSDATAEVATPETFGSRTQEMFGPRDRTIDVLQRRPEDESGIPKT